MLDDGHDPLGHEASTAYDDTRARHLRDLHVRTRVGDLDASTGLAGVDLVGLRAVADVDDDLDAIAFHVFNRCTLQRVSSVGLVTT